MNALNEISPQLKLKVSKRARRLTLRLDVRNREIHLVMPQRASLKKARTFAWDHEKWIREKLASLPVPVPFTNGETIPLLGRDMRLHVRCDKALKFTDITLNENELCVSTYLENPEGRIARFLKEYARKELSALAHEKAGQIGKTIKSIQIRDTKSRWGSCGHDKRLSFSWRLIFAPPKSMDYVVAHEVAHLVHMNHTPKFWHLCAELSADLPTGKGWMKKHGNSLMRYG